MARLYFFVAVMWAWQGLRCTSAERKEFVILLFILDGRWKLLPKWLCIVLFVLSPMMLVGMARQTAIAPTGATD